MTTDISGYHDEFCKLKDDNTILFTEPYYVLFIEFLQNIYSEILTFGSYNEQ